MADGTAAPRDRRPPEETFAERAAPLIELLERWRARIATEAQGWPAVPLSGLDPDDPRRLAARIAEELLRARGHLVAAEDARAYHRRERRGGAFTRTIQLPFRVDPERVEAQLENGVLRLSLQRPEEDKPRRIAITG